MFEVQEYQREAACRTLAHSRHVFHEALADGGARYHVHDPEGGDYDIVYRKNADYYRESLPEYARRLELIPDYKCYDEDDTATMRLDFLRQYQKYGCLHVNEYTLTLAYVVLRYTDGEVYFTDPRAARFLAPCARLHIGALPPEGEAGTLLLVGPFGPSLLGQSTGRLADTVVFHAVFTEQWLFAGRNREELKYVSIPSDPEAGIGAILALADRARKAFEPMGLRVIYKGERVGKHPLHELQKYFRLTVSPADAAPENTLEIDNMAALSYAWLFAKAQSAITADLFTEDFRAELEEYHDGVIRGRKALGVLVRGTDYLVAKMGGVRRMASAEQMIPTIREWVDRGGYEVIFLATEDETALEQMHAAFGDKLIAVAQERHTLEEFTDVRILNDLEKKLYREEEYDSRVMDTTINYFYALYLLSRCEGFIASGQCNGVDIVLSLHGSEFENYYRFNAESGG